MLLFLLFFNNFNRFKIILFINFRIQFIKIRTINIVNRQTIINNNKKLLQTQLFCSLKSNRFCYKSKTSSIRIRDRTIQNFQTTKDFRNRIKLKRMSSMKTKKHAKFEKKFQNQQNDDDNYYVSENLNYYESYNESTNDDDAIVYFIMSEMTASVFFNCRKCNQIFIFNNKLHQHVRKAHLSETVIIFIVLLTEFNLKQFFVLKSSFFIAVTKDSEKSFTDVISVVSFDVDFNKNVNIDYDFCDWSYDKINISLSVIDETESICLNFDFDITLADRQFFQRQAFDVSIRIMISFINIRELKINKHSSTEYAIIEIYFSRQKNDVSTKTKIIREIHLINHLKINMLLSNDIIESERMIFDSSNSVVHIDSCDVSISLDIKTSRIVVHTSIHARKTMIISSRSEIVVSIHYIIISIDRDFFFESKEMNFSFYAHLINSTFKNILIRNDDDKIVQIFRNCRLNRMIELNFANVFLIQINDDNDVAELTIRKFTSEHKINWFKKIIAAAYAIIVVLVNNNLFHDEQSSIIVVFSVVNILILNMFFIAFAVVSTASKIIFNNDIIIHQFSSVVVQIFTYLIQKYFDLWKNNEFAELSKKHWMKIFLKSDWEKRIFDKTKIYSLDTKNRELINDTFDKLHDVDKLNWTKNSIFFSFSMFCVWKTVNDEKKNVS